MSAETIRWIIVAFLGGAMAGLWVGGKLAFWFVRDEFRKDAEGGRWLNLNTNEISEFKDGEWVKTPAEKTERHQA